MTPPVDQARPLNRLREIWKSGERAFGAIATIPSIQSVQVLAGSGLDFIIVDMEHGPIDATAAHAMIAATAGTPLVPLVRVTGKEKRHAKLPLDLGAMGVCFPMTSSREDAEDVVKAVRYPPPANASGVLSTHRFAGARRCANTWIARTTKCWRSASSSTSMQ